jgi:hypothetical protein
MNLPWARVSPRTVTHVGVEPTTVVVQLLVPAVSDSSDSVMGATALMSGATVGDDSAVSSAVVKVEAVPKASLMPVLDVVLPGVMVSRFVPSEVISELTCAWAPSPRPTVKMTAAMPIRIPSTVRNDRNRWVRTPLRPVRSVSSQLIARSPGSGCRPR